MNIDITQSAIVRREQAATSAAYVVTGFNSRLKHSVTLYCDTKDETSYLIELLFRCGAEQASWAPNKIANK
jgi:hypothetical protein